MARSLKDAGMEELSGLKRRVNRQHALQRIHRSDRDELVELIDQIEAKIVSMDEKEEREGGYISW